MLEYSKGRSSAMNCNGDTFEVNLISFMCGGKIKWFIKDMRAVILKLIKLLIGREWISCCATKRLTILRQIQCKRLVFSLLIKLGPNCIHPAFIQFMSFSTLIMAIKLWIVIRKLSPNYPSKMIYCSRTGLALSGQKLWFCWWCRTFVYSYSNNFRRFAESVSKIC